MKKWWIVVLGVAFSSAAYAGPGGSVVDIKNDEGKTIANLVMCSSCKDPAAEGSKCVEGAVDGWLDGKPCGSCLVKSNWGVLVRYSRDLMVAGQMVLPDGKPAKKHYFKIFMPNGWGHRTQATDDGKFRVGLAATYERQKGEPLLVDLGERVDVPHDDGNDQFSVYMLPDGYAPCAEDAK